MKPQEIAEKWIAKNGEIRPVNPYTDDTLPICFDPIEERKQLYGWQKKHDEFEEAAKQHTYPCPTLADGEYSGEDLDFEWIEEMPEDSQLIIRLKQPPAIDEGERANTQQSVEEAAETIEMAVKKTYAYNSSFVSEEERHSYLLGAQFGANWQLTHALASSNMVELERVLLIIEDRLNEWIEVDKSELNTSESHYENLTVITEFKALITQIKNLTKE